MTHELSPRIVRHFDRLVEESAEFVEWTLLLNRGRAISPALAVPHTDPALLMPARYEAFLRGPNQGVQDGYLDLLAVPFVLAMQSSHVWVIEYDVDFSGSWRTLFEQFADTEADLICSYLRHRFEDEEWVWWSTASAPAWVRSDDWMKGYYPFFRLSRDFAAGYAHQMRDPAWGGHMEFTVTTAASALGAAIEDLGHAGGAFTPPGRRANYEPIGSELASYVTRPAWKYYFHEPENGFQMRERLYHPVKPGVALWESS
jgi:hypothetical protein